jgi:uncharacterized protein (TIGR02996 family)
VSVDLEQALLQALHDSPTDETSWLVLADWLEEQGDGRAEVLRAQQRLRGELPLEERLELEETVRRRLAEGVRPCVPLLVNSAGMTLALIRPGRFWMGSPPEEASRYADEDPRHEVEITRPFYLGVHQVTQAQYEEVMGHNPSHFQRRGGGADQVGNLDTRTFPVETLSWQDALAFCAALSDRQAEQSAGRVYRLPSEAEWEYACRAGTTCSAPFHYGWSLSSRQANFDGTRPYGEARRGRNLRRTCAVGSYAANAFGLHDMHGNVWEWCADWFDVDYYAESPRRDPPGPSEGDSRILRGGSFYYIGSSCRAAIRFGRRPDSRSNLDGFRVALSHSQ